MIQKKVCILGAFAVGKTSLVARFVHSVFSDKYHSTVGVKIDKKIVAVDGTETTLVLWDLHGEDDFQEVRTSYLRGMSGYFLVVDGTRGDTLDTAKGLCQRARDAVGDVPFICLVNKADLRTDWEIDDGALDELRRQDWSVILTSAKTGDGVEDAFDQLTQRMLSTGTTP